MVKKVGGGNLITFTIDGEEYQAEEGMTWEEWVNSEYNTIFARIDLDDSIIVGDGWGWIGTSLDYVHKWEPIINDGEYFLVG